MGLRGDRILDVLADLIARVVITAVIVAIGFRFSMRRLMTGDVSWQVVLAGGIAIGFLISLVAIRKRPEDP